MARTKYKLGQMLQTSTTFGRVKELRMTESTTLYVLDDENGTHVSDIDVTAVYRAVTPRKNKTQKAAPRSKKTASENRAAA